MELIGNARKSYEECPPYIPRHDISSEKLIAVVLTSVYGRCDNLAMGE